MRRHARPRAPAHTGRTSLTTFSIFAANSRPPRAAVRTVSGAAAAQPIHRRQHLGLRDFAELQVLDERGLVHQPRARQLRTRIWQPLTDHRHHQVTLTAALWRDQPAPPQSSRNAHNTAATWPCGSERTISDSVSTSTSRRPASIARSQSITHSGRCERFPTVDLARLPGRSGATAWSCAPARRVTAT